jgi:hypothetical protein
MYYFFIVTNVASMRDFDVNRALQTDVIENWMSASAIDSSDK